MQLNAVLEAAREVQSHLLKEGAEFCFIGGLAVQRWGEPRFTNDADLNLLTRFVDDEKWIDYLLDSFTGRTRIRLSLLDPDEFCSCKRAMALESTSRLGVLISRFAVWEERPRGNFRMEAHSQPVGQKI